MSNALLWAEAPQDSQTNLGFSSVKISRPGISPSVLVMKAAYMVLMQVTGRRKGHRLFRDERPSSIDWLWGLQPG